jgi:hypothetical protein
VGEKSQWVSLIFWHCYLPDQTKAHYFLKDRAQWAQRCNACQLKVEKYTHSYSLCSSALHFVNELETHNFVRNISPLPPIVPMKS